MSERGTKVSRHLVVSRSQFRVPRTEIDVALVHSTRSGRTWVVDRTTARALSEADFTGLSVAAVSALHGTGLLVDGCRDESAEVLAENDAAATSNEVLSMVLMPSSYCNFGCGYCGQEHLQRTLAPLHRRAVVQRLLAKADARPTRLVQVTWFGGEPLAGLPALTDISRKLLPELHDRGIAFAARIVTNGSLLTLDNFHRLYDDCRVRRFEITLDGPARLHDVLRPDKFGRPNYERIAASIQQILALDGHDDLRIAVRTNVGVANESSADEFASDMAARGFARDERISFYAAPIHPWGNDVSAQGYRGVAYGQTQLKWLDAYQRAGLRHTLVPRHRRRITCAAIDSRAEVIEASGRVFGCTEQPLVPGAAATALGTLEELTATVQRPPSLWSEWNSDVAAGTTSSECGSCHYLPQCGGGCPKAWGEGSVPCPPEKFNLPDKLDRLAVKIGLEPVDTEVLDVGLSGAAQEVAPSNTNRRFR